MVLYLNFVIAIKKRTPYGVLKGIIIFRVYFLMSSNGEAMFSSISFPAK